MTNCPYRPGSWKHLWWKDGYTCCHTIHPDRDWWTEESMVYVKEGYKAYLQKEAKKRGKYARQKTSKN